MSNPYASPDPSDPNGQQQTWSSQQSVPPTQPQNPYGQGGTGQYGTYPDQGQQAAWGQAGYGQYGMAASAQADQIRSNSTIVLVLGILGLVLIGLFGSIPAWVWGNSLIRQAQEAGLPEDITQNARIGKILGIIAVVLWGLGIVLAIILVIGFGVLASNSGGSY